MTQNKKNWLVVVFGIILPVVLSLINGYYSDLNTFEWGHANLNKISNAAFILSTLFSSYIVLKSHNTIWRIFGVLILLVSITILIIGYSLSNFGF